MPDSPSCNIAGLGVSSVMEDVSVTSAKRRAESPQEDGTGKKMIDALVCLVDIGDVYNLERIFYLFTSEC